MIALQISDNKSFMGQLLLHEAFDNFLVNEVDLSVAYSVHMNGKINKDWLDDSEKEALEGREYSTWKELKGVVYQMIRGNRSPLSMKIVFALNSNNLEKIVKRTGGTWKASDVEGLYLNIRYENGQTFLITGTSYRTFTLDKSLEHEWDDSVKTYLKHYQISFEER